MLRFWCAMVLVVAGCDSVLGLGDFTDKEQGAPATASNANAGGGSTSATGEAGTSFGGSGGSTVEGGGGPGGMTTAKKVVFVTSASFAPEQIGNVSGANSLCQAFAGSSGLGGTYQAWFSDNATIASANVTGQGPWYLLGGEQVFATRTDLLAMNAAPEFPIDIAENMAKLPAFDRVWTGTVKGGDRGKVCLSGNDDWVNDGAVFGTSGVIGQPANWTNAGEQSCNSPYHIYCFEL